MVAEETLPRAPKEGAALKLLGFSTRLPLVLVRRGSGVWVI